MVHRANDRDDGPQQVLDPPEVQPNPSRPSVRGGAEALKGDASRENAPAVEPEPGRQTGDEGGDKSRAARLRRHPIAAAIGVILLVAIVAGGYLYWDDARHFESTDDAFIGSRQFAVAPKVAGYLTAVLVTDNQHVSANDVIARIDDRDYRIALAQAEALVAASEASVRSIDAQIAVQLAQVEAAQAQVARAEAAMKFSEEDAARYRQLAQQGYGTVQLAQQTQSKLQQDQASLADAQAALKAAQRQMETLKAQLNLSYTTVTAAQAGRIVRLTAAVGQLVQPGTSLTMFVPDEIWVTANFKETQLANMRPGQPVTMRIDAYPDRTVHGHVESVQPGSGPAFSLLPPENATGNYVKIVQRVPVKLLMDNPPTDVAVGPGMSVVPTVRVRAEPSLYRRLMGRV
jgi:membrane fusion protein (multidrug efflux system)